MCQPSNCADDRVTTETAEINATNAPEIKSDAATKKGADKNGSGIKKVTTTHAWKVETDAAPTTLIKSTMVKEIDTMAAKARKAGKREAGAATNASIKTTMFKEIKPQLPRQGIPRLQLPR